MNQFDEQFIITELSLSRSVVGQLEMSILVGAFKSTQSINFFPTKNRNLTEIEKFIRVFNCANTIVPSLSLNLCYNMCVWFIIGGSFIVGFSISICPIFFC